MKFHWGNCRSTIVLLDFVYLNGLGYHGLVTKNPNVTLDFIISQAFDHDSLINMEAFSQKVLLHLK